MARVAGLALILHSAPGGPEQIMHVREGIRFELYDGGYSQLKLVVPPWRERGAAETPESRPRPDLEGPIQEKCARCGPAYKAGAYMLN